METINYPKVVKARKVHVCDWCGCIIPIKEKYHSAVYKYDRIYAWKNHIKCMELVVKLNMEGDYGITSKDFHEYITEEFKDIWSKIDNKYYESDCFRIPCFQEQLEFVYKHRC